MGGPPESPRSCRNLVLARLDAPVFTVAPGAGVITDVCVAGNPSRQWRLDR
ncbi:hypothetical protein ACWEF6_39080 [Amycolatopsis sp. NPDC004772]